MGQALQGSATTTHVVRAQYSDPLADRLLLAFAVLLNQLDEPLWTSRYCRHHFHELKNMVKMPIQTI